MSRRALLGATTAAAALGLAGCTGTAPDPSSPASPRRTLDVGATLEPATMDLTTSDAASIPQLLLYNVYETLLKVNADGDIRPLLASRWDASTDGRTYTFTLDPLAKFASGEPVTAAAAAASINKLRQAPSATIRSQLAVVSDAVATDVHTLTVSLSRPSNNWLYAMTSTPGIIMDPASGDLATQPMGSGPFALGTWTKGDRISLVKNASYWGTPTRLDEVTFRYYTDPNAMVSAMLSGDLDIISNLTSPASLPVFADTSRFTTLVGTTNGEVVLGMNHARPAFADRRVRQAVCHAIDRKALLDTVWAGKGTLIGSMVVPTDPYFEDLSNMYPYDPALARSLLAQAGASNLSLALRVPVTKYATDSAQFIASQLAQVGITANVEELDFSGRWLPEVFTNGDYDLTIVAHVEPRDIVKFANPAYYWHYDNPEFQTAIADADAAPAAQFNDDMKKAARILADDAAADWLFVLPSLIIVGNGVTGVAANATTLSFDLTTIAIKN